MDTDDHFSTFKSIYCPNNGKKEIVPANFSNPLHLQQECMDPPGCFELSVQIVGSGIGGFGRNTNYDGKWMSKLVDGKNDNGRFVEQVQIDFNDPMNQLIPEIYFYVNET